MLLKQAIWGPDALNVFFIRLFFATLRKPDVHKSQPHFEDPFSSILWALQLNDALHPQQPRSNLALSKSVLYKYSPGSEHGGS